ncbi:MAG: TetR/AcrR family transcriptional regulator [Caulobacter sp.]|nr:TetR/AcrR family transcriptional regulator [Caulobacter sp.]
MMISAELPPRAARTRSALIAAGFDLLAVKPIDAIPIDEVVAKAGVAKGSFFNHFADKHAFAAAIAAEVRRELEDQVTGANAAVADPMERIANGMRVSAAFAINNPKRAAALLRGAGNMTERSHPLNKGVADDFDQADKLGLLSQEARSAGVLYWLGLCQALMASLLETSEDRPRAQARVREMMLLGLMGLGLQRGEAMELARKCCASL